jgi:hypothetical protein
MIKPTPAALLIDATVDVIALHWSAAQKANGGAIKNANIADLRIAYEYTTRMEAGVYKIEREKYIKNQEWLFRNKNTKDQKDASFSNGFLSEFFAIIGITLVVFLLITPFYIIIMEIIKNPYVLLTIAPLLIFWFLLMRFGEKFGDIIAEKKILPPEYEWVFAAGEFRHLQIFLDKTSKELKGERELIVAMMGAKGEGFPSPIDVNGLGDEDLTAGDLRNLPVPPGITEIVMETYDAAIYEIRDHLKKVRRFHNLMGWGAFIAFIGSLVVTFWLSASAGPNEWQNTVGSVGFGGLVGLFCVQQMRETRRAQIALALFASYMAELRANLLEAESQQDDAKRRRMRGEAWRYFRSGLNALWQEENKTATLPKAGDEKSQSKADTA